MNSITINDSINELKFDLNKQKILRIKEQNQMKDDRRRLQDICRLLNDDNNNSDDISDLSTLESSRDSSEPQKSSSLESLRALTLEETLLVAEVNELQERQEPEEEEEDEDLREFTRIERDLKAAELHKLLDSVRQQIKSFSERRRRSAPLAESESLSEEREDSQERRTQRPLTLYMPIVEEELDLRQHILTLGHELDSTLEVVVSQFTCFGYLRKLCQKSEKKWRKRFFLFDRKNKNFVYFSTKRQFARNESPKGGVAFDSILDVYVDHERTIQDNRQVFVVGANQRQFVLSTTTPEVMRVWVDVVVTGAQGYHLF